jgi:hypothetical protein|tara:strand:+ start:400 stop:846 length:447 start_codon:yes stop_codon:yes gene_type:complete
MGGKRKKVVSLAKEFERGSLPRKEFDKLVERFEKDGTYITWDSLIDTAKLLYDTPEDAHEVLTNYSQNLRKAHQGTQPIVDFINAKLRKKKQPINKIINDNLKELCPWVDIKYSSVSPTTTKPVRGKLDRASVIKKIFMRYSRAKDKE